MYLKALELQGFKSFADKTTIQLHGNITAIVGPNGSGKSNISDAIRWVLGEQSTKSLRGTKMEDVIFGGTQKRAQVGYAEASLIFDNSDGALAYDSGEVMVTRRYFRSGESEYYINRQQARLRDILELFMDTGIGKEGYSNIGQGKIDEILALKSTDRREIFEEAAGISKYRHRKEETERKLQTTEDNLLRIGDKISELELQIGPLKTQAEKAEKYLVLKEELAGNEIAVWLDSLSKIAAGTKKADEDYISANFILSGEKENESALYAKEDTLSAQLLSMDGEIELSRNELSQKKDSIHEAESRVALCKNEIDNREQNISRLQEDMEAQRSISDSVSGKIADARQRISDLEQEIAQYTRDISGKEEETLRAAGADSEGRARLLQLRNQLSHIAEQLTKNESDREYTQQQQEEKSMQLLHLREECEKSAQKLSELQESSRQAAQQRKEAGEQAEAVRNSLNGYQLRFGQTKQKLENARKQQQQLEISCRTDANRLSMLEAMERDLEGFHKSVKLVMQEFRRGTLRGIYGPVASLIRADSDYALAIETALGASQQSIICDTEQSGKAAILYLKNHSAGRATFLPVSVMKGNLLKEAGLEDCIGFIGLASELCTYDARYTNVIENLLGRTVIAEDMDCALAMARRYGNRFKIVTLDGQVLNPGGSMTGGSAAQGSGVLSRANEIEQLKKSLQKQQASLEQLTADVTEQNRKLEETNYRIEVLQTELRTHEDLLLRTDNDIRNLDTLIETVSSVRAEDEQELSALTVAIAQLKASAEALTNSCEALLSEKNSAEETLAAAEAELNRTSDEVKNFEAAISELREKRASCESELNSSRNAISNFEKILSDLEEEKQKKGNVIDRYREEIGTLSQELDTHTQTLLLRQKDAESAELSHQRLLKQRTDLDNERTLNSRKAREATQKIAALESEVYRLDQKRKNYEAEEQSITEKLWDNYALTPGTAGAKAAPVESISAAQKHISELKRKISGLGTPNLGAIEEYNRLNERYTYLSEQRDDVTSAKTELQNVLRNITKEMTVIFTAEFEKINRYFSETFVEMFNGGKAALILENPEEPLDCGIEIKVQPPGKQLKTITLLSGGEKAFVAIALYFAILKVRPTPFCMLDEIDAALDDRNVERFAHYLRSLSQKTQFIVITHRRGTMEEAEALYGVTMQEQGVSKILHLDLDALSQQLGIEAN